MKTDLLYLNDTYLFESEGTFAEVREHEKGTAVILKETIFYPQGGGQPTDTGFIKSETGVFRVDYVGLDADGLVWHIGEFESGSFEAGQTVQLVIDAQKRLLHARIHTAGHLIDCALQDLAPEIKADKGFHFTEGSYVEGTGALPEDENFKAKLEVRVNELVTQDIPTKVQDLTEVEATERGFVAPAGKSVRIVWFGEYRPAGCGGTHVRSSKETGPITITKTRMKKGRAKISYSIE